MPGTKSSTDRLAFGEPPGARTLATNRLVLLAAVPLFLVLAVVAYITIQFAANEVNGTDYMPAPADTGCKLVYPA